MYKLRFFRYKRYNPKMINPQVFYKTFNTLSDVAKYLVTSASSIKLCNIQHQLSNKECRILLSKLSSLVN